MLNLLKIHDLACNIDHKITHVHDPCADVTLTKCLFDRLLRGEKPNIKLDKEQLKVIGLHKNLRYVNITRYNYK